MLLYIKAFRLCFKKESGSRLLSHAVSSIVPSAVQGLTVVFGMGTGVPPARIAAGCLLSMRRISPSGLRFLRFSLLILLPPSGLRFLRTFLLSPLPPLRIRRLLRHLNSNARPYFFSLRKEVIQPHLPIRLPCYDFTPVTRPAFGCSSLSVRSQTSGISDSHGVTGGVYKTRERIHRGILIRDY